MSVDLYGHFNRCVDLIHNPFRGVNYRDIILPLLFYKIASDTYKDCLQEIEDQVGKGIAHDSVWHEVVVPPDFSWENVCESDGRLADSVLDGYQRVSHANRDSFGKVLHIDADQLRKLEDGRLESIVEHISSQNLSRKSLPTEKLGLNFQRIARKLNSFHRYKGRSLPPRSQSQLLVSLLSPIEPGSTVHDPMCGVGASLTGTAWSVQGKGQDLSQVSVSGQEHDPDLSKIARMNLYAHQIDCHIQRGGAPVKPGFIRDGSPEQFDYALGVLIPEAKTLSRSPNRGWQPELAGWTYDGSDSEVACFLHGVSRLNESGRGAFCVSTSLLFGRESTGLRKRLVEGDLIEAIVRLPEDHPQEGDESRSIVVIDRAKPTRNGDKVFFLAAEDSALYRGLGDRKRLSGEGGKQICRMVENQKEMEGMSRVVQTTEIESKEWALDAKEHVGS